MPNPTALLSLPKPLVQAARPQPQPAASEAVALEPSKSSFETSLRDASGPVDAPAPRDREPRTTPESRETERPEPIEPEPVDKETSAEPTPEPQAEAEPVAREPETEPEVERQEREPEPEARPEVPVEAHPQPRSAQELPPDPAPEKAEVAKTTDPSTTPPPAIEPQAESEPGQPDAPARPSVTAAGNHGTEATGDGSTRTNAHPNAAVSPSLGTPSPVAPEAVVEPQTQPAAELSPHEPTTRSEARTPSPVAEPAPQSTASAPTPAVPTTPAEARPSVDAGERTAAPPPGPAARAEARQEQTSSQGDQGPKQQQTQPLPRPEAAEKAPPAVARAEQVEQTVRLHAAEARQAGEGQTSPSSTTVQPAAKVELGAAARPATAAPVLAPERPIEGEQFAGRVVRSLSAMVSQRGGIMHMRLDPPELGQLRIRMTIVRGVVSAEFHATTQQAQSMLDRSLAVLRTSLESQGLTVERLTVHTQAQSHQQQMTHQNERQDQSASRQHHDASDGRSRGRGDDDAQHPDRRSGGSRRPFAERFSRLAASLSEPAA